MNKLKDLIHCGNIFKHSNGKDIIISISKFDTIYNKIIPLFNKYEIIGIKSLDYQDFCRTAEIIKKGTF
jgi:hypothetical protein